METLRKENLIGHNHKNITNFEIGQIIIVKNHTCHTFEPKYLPDYNVLKVLDDSTPLLMTPNGKERKANINNVKPCKKTELVKNAWNSFLSLEKNKCQNCNYSLRPHCNSKT